MYAFTPAETHAVLHAARTGELTAAAAAAAAAPEYDAAPAPAVRTLLGKALVAAGTRLLDHGHRHGHGYGRGPAHPHAA
ncbi:hypothetical protein OHS33_13720 [Streptomyces sp. NBC_00536]|uniref:hypothetical protein n=1 Tax=Streptomyces sp. NBC_00536 TaxID=2975769 RepID=UPI002E81870C|nr:hypothetical protein [Streptomyces sp. NBC_00536]WUC79302.1 hypothetical protein OHS33_13720 [Streptomyces sp. NBC_00536]